MILFFIGLPIPEFFCIVKPERNIKEYHKTEKSQLEISDNPGGEYPERREPKKPPLKDHKLTGAVLWKEAGLKAAESAPVPAPGVAGGKPDHSPGAEKRLTGEKLTV